MSAPIVLRVRNDRELGILVLTIRKKENHTYYFFKPQYQELRRHPIEVQQIVKRSRPTGRMKSVTIDAISFLHQYLNGTTFTFKGVNLTSSDVENVKSFDRLLNKEIGAKKRLATIKAKKLAKDEEAFQERRAQRLGASFASQQEAHSSTMDPTQMCTTAPRTSLAPMDLSDDHD